VRDIRSHLDSLAALAHADGGWGYAPGQPAHVEPTCLGLLALSLDADRFGSAMKAGRAALARCAAGDGIYRLDRGRDEAVWPTALVLFTQAALGPADEAKRTATALLALRGRAPDVAQAAEVHDIDLKIVGWPWADGNFSWAEPTAWACLALRRVGYGGHERVAEGVRLLLDRAFDGGGINYGNRLILGRPTEPIPGPTAVMLLALQGHADHPRVAASAFYLTEKALASTDLEHLCWARLALELHHDQPGVSAALPTLEERIVAASAERKGEEWLRPAPLREALTALALGGGAALFAVGNALRGVPSDRNATEGVPYKARRKPLGERVRSIFRGFAVRAAGNLRQPPPQTAVHVAPAADYNADLADALRRQYESFRDRVPLKGKRVVLKPNLVEYHRDKVINTHPNVVAAAIELCRREGAGEIIVAEGPGHWRNVEYLVQASGLGDVLRHYKVPFIDLNHDEPVKSVNLGRLTGMEYLYLSRTVATADVLISLPKLKTHHWAGATLSLKNLFGTLPGICYGWPKNELHWRGIDNSIVDIALTRTPDLAVVDGVVGMDGDGPINGTPKPFGALVMGCDPLAVDATCCRLMGLRPEKIAYLVMGYRKKLGLFREEEIQQLGEAIAALAQPFATVPHHQELCAGRSA
jgi:uncharacterized protein (DUF362 family)